MFLCGLHALAGVRYVELQSVGYDSEQVELQQVELLQVVVAKLSDCSRALDRCDVAYREICERRKTRSGLWSTAAGLIRGSKGSSAMYSEIGDWPSWRALSCLGNIHRSLM